MLVDLLMRKSFRVDIVAQNGKNFVIAPCCKNIVKLRIRDYSLDVRLNETKKRTLALTDQSTQERGEQRTRWLETRIRQFGNKALADLVRPGARFTVRKDQ